MCHQTPADQFVVSIYIHANDINSCTPIFYVKPSLTLFIALLVLSFTPGLKPLVAYLDKTLLSSYT